MALLEKPALVGLYQPHKVSPNIWNGGVQQDGTRLKWRFHRLDELLAIVNQRWQRALTPTDLFYGFMAVSTRYQQDGEAYRPIIEWFNPADARMSHVGPHVLRSNQDPLNVYVPAVWGDNVLAAMELGAVSASYRPFTFKLQRDAGFRGRKAKFRVLPRQSERAIWPHSHPKVIIVLHGADGTERLLCPDFQPFGDK